MITIAIANQKGGVGKTTTAVSLSAALAMSGKRVLLVDLDAQASATLWLTDDYGPKGHVVYNVLMRSAALRDCVKNTPSRVDLLPSDLELSKADVDLSHEMNREQRLAKALRGAGDYEYALVDCPPNLGLCTLNALAAADILIIPIDCRPQAFVAVPSLIDAVLSVQDEYERAIGLYALPTFLLRTNVSRDIHDKIRNRFGEAGTLPAIHMNTRLVEAYMARQTIFDYDKASSGAVEYLRVSKELLHDFEEQKLSGRARQAG
jgi:chromosome partitioning protein